MRLAGSNRSEESDGNQLVDGEHASQDACDSQLEDRVAKDDRADERADARYPVVRASEPLHEEGVGDEHHAGDHSREVELGVVVVVATTAAVVLVIVDFFLP